MQKSIYQLLVVLFIFSITGCFLDFKKKDLSKYNFNEGTFFDGKSMVHIEILNQYVLDDAAPFTFEATIKADTSQLSYPTILSSREEDDFLKSTLFFLWSTGVPTLYLGAAGGNACAYRLIDDPNTKYPTNSPNLLDNQWHHIVITRDTSNISFYVDQKLVCKSSGGHSLGFNTSFRIGGDRASRYNTYFHGFIKNVGLWNSYTSDIHEFTKRNVTGKEPDLLGYWPLNPSSENPFADLSLNKSHGVWSN